MGPGAIPGLGWRKGDTGVRQQPQHNWGKVSHTCDRGDGNSSSFEIEVTEANAY